MDDVSVTTVQIFGREYKIKGYADEGYVEKVASYVDGKIKELAGNSTVLSHEQLATLAALNIADELFQQTKNSSETITSIERRTDDMVLRLEQSLLAEK